jgi:hypothetical protein
MTRLLNFMIVGCTLVCGCGKKNYTVVHPSDEARLHASSDVVVDGELARMNYYSGSPWSLKAPAEPDHVEFTVTIDRVVKGTPPEPFRLWLKLQHDPGREMALLDPDGSGARALPLPVRVGFDRGLFGGVADIWIMRRA